MKRFYLGFLSLFLMLAACNNDDDNNDGNNPDPVEELSIYETAVASAELTTLVEALERTGLDEVLNAEGTYTVFAPTNDAFSDAGISLDDFTEDELSNLLLNHVLDTEVRSESLTTGYQSTLATGPGAEGSSRISLFVNTDGAVTLNAVASPLADGLDIEATNGIIHLIDTPLSIPDVVDHVVNNPDLQALEDAVISFGEELTGILTGEGPFTIFAPTNEAFENLATIPGLDITDEDILRTILLFHVIPGENVVAGDLTPGMPLTTATPESEILFTDSEEGTRLIDGTGGSGINILETDIQGSNGVIHRIDRVLLPPSIVNALVTEANLYQFARLTAGYDLLADAIEKAELVDMLSDPEADLTVFAPDNEALETYLGDAGLTLETVEAAFLRNLLMNHMLQGQFTGEDIAMAESRYFTTLATLPDNAEANISMHIAIVDDEMFPGLINGEAGVIPTNSQASNGIVHVVDRVIDLPTIVTFALADQENFSSLTAALTSDGQPDFVGILGDPENEDAPFTVFAPVNSAFDALETVPSGEALTAVLQHHVAAGVNVRSTDLAEGDNPLTTLEGDDVVVKLPGTDGAIADITDGSGETGGIILVDVQAINGVIHAIDKVLIPDTTN